MTVQVLFVTEPRSILSGAARMSPVRDKATRQERNLQGSSSYTGLPQGHNMSLLELPGPTQTVTRSQDERGSCKAALPLGVVPGGWYVPFLFLSYCY